MITMATFGRVGLASPGGAADPPTLFAARFDRGNFGEISRKRIRFKGFHFHLDKTDKGTTEVRFLLAAAIDNHADRGNDPAVCVHDIDRLLDAPAACDNVFGDDEFFALVDRKPTSQSEAAGFFLDKDVTLTQGATDFLPDDDAAEGRGDDGVAIERAQFISQLSAHALRDVGVLQQKRALKILATVQTGTQNKVTVEQRTSFAEEGKKILAHDFPGSARALACSFPRPRGNI